jgi:hypothetical protein
LLGCPQPFSSIEKSASKTLFSKVARIEERIKLNLKITNAIVSLQMSDSIMYQEDAFVVLETDREEQFLSAEELKEKLKNILRDRTDDLPRELQKFTSLEEQAQHLMENYYEFDIGTGQYLQWYVVRLEK